MHLTTVRVFPVTMNSIHPKYTPPPCVSSDNEQYTPQNTPHRRVFPVTMNSHGDRPAPVQMLKPKVVSDVLGQAITGGVRGAM